MTEIKWQEPPADGRGGRSEADEVAAQLKARPGEWALIEQDAWSSAASKWRKRGLEVTVRSTGKVKGASPTYDIYARFVEEGDR